MLILPRNDFKKQAILSKVAGDFKEGVVYTESEVNEIIKGFLVDDHVLCRRELVNFNYLAKDSYEGTYWLKKAELSSEELDAIKNNQKRIKDSGLL